MLVKFVVMSDGSGLAAGRPSSAVSRSKKGFILMSVVAWIFLGLISGFIASKIVNKRGDGTVVDIILGIIGAVVGGFIFNLVGASGVTGFNIWSMLVAVLGAVVVLVVKHKLLGQGPARV
jgi:uncharacterized membrane protein YeaQ/YmgE (transglycosylase-associated protein family)